MVKAIPTEHPIQLPAGGLKKLLRSLDSDYPIKQVSPDESGRIALTREVIKNGVPHLLNGAVYLKKGNIYTVTYEGFTPPIATRLYTGGFINEETYQYLSQLEFAKVGKEAIQNGYITQEILDNINRQMVLSSLTYLYGWEQTFWQWEPNEVFDDFSIPELPIKLFLAAADERMGQWEALGRKFPQVTKPNSIPCPGRNWLDRKNIDSSPEMERVSKIVATGDTTIAKLATLCGFTRFEIAATLAKAVIDGIVTIIDPEKIKSLSGSILDASKFQNDYNLAKEEVELAKATLASAENHFNELKSEMGVETPD